MKWVNADKLWQRPKYVSKEWLWWLVLVSDQLQIPLLTISEIKEINNLRFSKYRGNQKLIQLNVESFQDGSAQICLTIEAKFVNDHYILVSNLFETDLFQIFTKNVLYEKVH